MSALTRTFAALALAAAATAAPAPAHAARLCLENNQLTFTPALNLNNQAGTVTLAVQGTCADVPGVLTPSHYANNTLTFPYFGSCALAFIAEGSGSQIVGGTLYFFVIGTTAKVEVLVPNNVCPISSARGTGVLVSVP